MKFDPCGARLFWLSAALKHQDRTGFDFTQHSMTVAANELMSSSGGAIGTVAINLLSLSLRSALRSGCRSSGLERKLSARPAM
jgi:hypothetical protein